MSRGIEVKVQELEATGNFKVVRKFAGLPPFFNQKTAVTKVMKVCFLDTETTSLDTNECEVIDLAFRIVEFDKQGRFYQVLSSYQLFNQPSQPLSDDVKKVTGYTDEMLAGRAIDWPLVESMVSECTLIVAYNSAFDRPVLERQSPVFKEANWGCAMVDADWFELFGAKGKLEWLAYKIAGLFFEAHQALADVDIMVKLLSQSIPADANKTVFATMLDSMRVKQFRVRAVGAPFDAKDALKAAGYRWEDVPGKAKAWCTNAQESALEEVRGFLSGLGCSSPAVNPITLKDRFTNRV